MIMMNTIKALYQQVLQQMRPSPIWSKLFQVLGY